MHSSDRSGPDDSGQFDPHAAIARFVERVHRRTGPAPSVTGPATGGPPRPSNPVDRNDLAGLFALREAGRRATEVYPGPVGELVARELDAVAEFGFRFARDTLTQRLVEHLLELDKLKDG